MRNILSLLTLLTILLPCPLLSQEYSYTHYDISEGLAGSTVYCITQDKDGFIWLGTETGVSRFDGTNFRSFATDDGLPDVEVLEIFGDSRGRVWMSPFGKAACYYFRGKIHTTENDSLLRNLGLTNGIYSFTENSSGDILMGTRNTLFLIRQDNTTSTIDSINGQPIKDCGAISTSADGHFLVQAGNMIYKFSAGHFSPWYPMTIANGVPSYIAMNSAGVIWREDSVTTKIHSFATGRTVTFPFERIRYRHNTFTTIGDSLFCFNENSGGRIYNINTGKFRIFLPAKEVSKSFRDATGNTWFTTLGQGIFRLNSDEFQTIRLHTPNSTNSSILAFRRAGNKLLAGGDQDHIFVFSLPDLSPIGSFEVTGAIKNRILYIDTVPGGRLLAASDANIRWISPDYHAFGHTFTGVRACYPFGPDSLLIASPWGVGVVDLHELKVRDTLYHERATAVYCHRDTIFVGTLNGLYGILPDRSVRFYGADIPILRQRISAIEESGDGTLWVATYDAGLVGFRQGAIIARLTKGQGLSSNICRALLVRDDALWVGTDKGLTKIYPGRPGFPMEHYTSQDGLGSDIINTIYGDGPVIYVGTPVGFSFFDETRVNVTEDCKLYLLSIQNSGSERVGDSAALLLPYTDKHLRLQFAGISYRSVGDVNYRYRIMGLDSAWRTTRETFLEYPALPSGKFELQLQAINKFGSKSHMLSLHFEVATPWWQSAWFYAAMLITFLCLTWLFVSLRIRQIRNRQAEKEKLNQRIMEMEHMALQAQMNPHFIFNCLNSIQQYIFNQDIFAANKYISGFSRLIRSTLHNSSKPFIALSDEISYLSDYLYLEKLRFKDKMDYQLDVDVSLRNEHYTIPPMLIQPYVENSMRHGLRHKSEGRGLIQLLFRREDRHLSVTVEDNGIGRRQAAAYKTREHIEYQSKGMSLTADRIRMLNAKYGEPISVEVIDLQDDTGRPAGTRVIMKFPLFHHLISENENYDQNHFSRR